MDYLVEIAKINPPFSPVPLPKAKQAFDIVVSLLLCAFLLPLEIFILLCFALEWLLRPVSRGPVFYAEIRISKGKPFLFYKFRIFKTSVLAQYRQAHGFIQTKELEQNPNNLTLTGRLLKQIYLDELPQLLNVLKGDMTLVGPRPTNVAVTWQDGQAGRFQRYLFICGVTGPFQVVKDQKNRADQTLTDMKYIEFCKSQPDWKIILNDLKILGQTILIILRARGV